MHNPYPQRYTLAPAIHAVEPVLGPETRNDRSRMNHSIGVTNQIPRPLYPGDVLGDLLSPSYFRYGDVFGPA